MTGQDQQQATAQRPSSNLIVHVRGTGVLARLLGATRATWMEFTTATMDFESPKRFSIGDQVLIDLTLGDLRLQQLPAIVRSRRPSSSGIRRYGVEFTSDADPAGLALIKSLLLEITPNLGKDSMVEMLTEEQRNALRP